MVRWRAAGSGPGAGGQALKLITWNVNGLRSVLKKGFLGWLAAARPDVLCLQEVRAAPAQLEEEFWHTHGYHAFWNPAACPGYSGVLTLCRREPGTVHLGIGREEFDVEGRVVRSEHAGFILYNVYFPSGQRGHDRVEFKLRFYAALLDLLDAERAAGRELVICGDFNTAHREIDLARPRENRKTSGFLPEERAWIDIYLAHGLVDIFRKLHPEEPGHYTWWSTVTRARERGVGWRLDYFLLSPGLVPAVQTSYILPEVAGSDHCPVVLELDAGQSQSLVPQP